MATNFENPLQYANLTLGNAVRNRKMPLAHRQITVIFCMVLITAGAFGIAEIAKPALQDELRQYTIALALIGTVGGCLHALYVSSPERVPFLDSKN